MNLTVSSNRTTSESGFTLVELMVSLAVLTVVLLAMLALFDATNKVAHAQANIADTQQNVRVAQDQVVRSLRIAARGWQVGTTPGYMPVADEVILTDNVGSSTFVDGSADATLKVLPGTDIIRMRGVVNGSMFLVSDPEQVALVPKIRVIQYPLRGEGQIDPTLVSNSSGAGGQDLIQFQKLKTAGNAFSLLLVNKMGAIAMAPGKIESGGDNATDDVTISFEADKGKMTYGGTAGEATWLAGTAAPRPPVPIVGVLEDFAFYVRENNGHPRLSLARFEPGTNTALGGKVENLRQDISDDILDLQAAMAVDGSSTCADLETCTYPDADKQINIDNSEWWNAGFAHSAGTLSSNENLYYLRVSVLGRTAGRDLDYVSPPITSIENHTYTEPTQPANNTQVVSRSFHRRLLTTIVDMRNL